MKSYDIFSAPSKGKCFIFASPVKMERTENIYSFRVNDVIREIFEYIPKEKFLYIEGDDVWDVQPEYTFKVIKEIRNSLYNREEVEKMGLPESTVIENERYIVVGIEVENDNTDLATLVKIAFSPAMKELENTISNYLSI